MNIDIDELKKIAQELLPFVTELVTPEVKILKLAISEFQDSGLKMYNFIENQSKHPEIFGDKHSAEARVFLKEIDAIHTSREEELKNLTQPKGEDHD